MQDLDRTPLDQANACIRYLPLLQPPLSLRAFCSYLPMQENETFTAFHTDRVVTPNVPEARHTLLTPMMTTRYSIE